MKKMIGTAVLLTGATVNAHAADEETKHVQVGIASYATVISNDVRGVEDDELSGFALQATGAPNDNFGIRGLYGQQEHDDVTGLDVNVLEASVLGGTGLATEGFKAYGSFGFFDEDWEFAGDSIGVSGAMFGGGIGYNWEPVSIDFWLNIRDSSDYEDVVGADVDLTAVSGGLGIAARF